jgi:hypothetical protein
MGGRPLGPQEFEALLRQLGRDREEAGRRYEQLRSRLVTVFTYRRCAGPEELADQTLDRVARRVLEKNQDGWEDLTAFAYGVAWNVARESFRSARTMPLPDEWDPPDSSDRDGDHPERRDACLGRCLTALPAEDRGLLMSYFEHAGGEKIRQRALLARELSISPNALRLRIHRLLSNVRPCVLKCLSSERGHARGN